MLDFSKTRIVPNTKLKMYETCIFKSFGYISKIELLNVVIIVVKTRFFNAQYYTLLSRKVLTKKY
ncbi:MAG TPA: hypothetical protein DEO86_12880 [Colwellia sp.]|nr:hypothetical protein [Colwellia sp.]